MGDEGEDDGEMKRPKKRMLRPGRGESGKGPSHACCQTGSPGKRTNSRGGEVGACIPLEEVVVVPSDGDVGC